MGDVTHFYVAKRYDRGGGFSYSDKSVKLLCTGQYVPHEQGRYGRKHGFLGNACTVPGKVTCPECLQILIPRQEELLAQMKATLARSQVPLIDFGPVEGWAPLLEFGTVAEMRNVVPEEDDKPRKARCQDSVLTVYVWDPQRKHWAASARSPG